MNFSYCDDPREPRSVEPGLPRPYTLRRLMLRELARHTYACFAYP
jgi:hypothetical protein